MELEFELEKSDEDFLGNIAYKVKRKGLQVGFLMLMGEPYSMKEAKVKNMKCY